MRFTYCPYCGNKLAKKEMLMLGYKDIVEKDNFTLSKEVDSVKWVKLESALELL